MKLCDKNKCTGCAACLNVCARKAISMLPEEEGFLCPKIDDSLCVECGACFKVCPVISPIDMSNHCAHTYAAYAKELSIRQRGSSGGMFTVLANWIFSNGGVVVGAAFDDGHVVHHTIATSEEELRKLQGSKYVQSDIGKVYSDIKKHLALGKMVLFVGTSCQVAGLRSFLKRPQKNLYTVDLVCHGVPSPQIFAKYIRYLRSKDPYFYAYSFRQLDGWNCNSSSRFPSGKIRTKTLYGYDSGYFAFFINGYMNRECCYHCSYAKSTPRIGDITLADFWGIGKTLPYEHDTRYGVSFISPNTKQGEFLFNAIKDEIIYEERNVSETIKDGDNSQLAHPAHRPEQRSSFYEKAYSLTWEDLVKYYNLPLKKKRRLCRRILSKIKHIIFG